MLTVANQNEPYTGELAKLVIPRFGNGTTNGAGSAAMVALPIAYAKIIGGIVTKIIMVHPGGKYTVAPTVTITSNTGVGSGATGVASIDSNGDVIGVSITAGGTLYEVPPVVLFSAGTTNAAYIREAYTAVGVTFNAGATGIWHLNRNVKKILIDWQSAVGTAKAVIGFWSEAMWTPNTGLTAALVTAGTSGYTLAALTEGLTIQNNTGLERGQVIIAVPQGIFSDVDGPSNGFIGIKASAAVAFRMCEIY